jgi:hypothetical protein
MTTILNRRELTYHYQIEQLHSRSKYFEYFVYQPESCETEFITTDLTTSDGVWVE